VARGEGGLLQENRGGTITRWMTSGGPVQAGGEEGGEAGPTTMISSSIRFRLAGTLGPLGGISSELKEAIYVS